MFNQYLRDVSDAIGGAIVTTIVTTIVATIGVALTGCASLPDPESTTAGLNALPVRADAEVTHALPLAGEPDEEILAGRVNVATSEGLINYGARYEIRQGKLFDAIREGDGDLGGARDELALQTLEQKIGSTLPLPAGSPLRLAVTSREQSRLGLGDRRQTHSTNADLRWSPGPVDLQVQWSPPRAQLPARGVDCNLRADVQLPAQFMPGASDSTFELSGQRCRTPAPEAGLADVELARWGAAWSWGGRHYTSVHVLHTEPAAPVGHRTVLTPDYELGFSHERELPGGWQAETSVSMLRSDAPHDTYAASTRQSTTDWSADLALTRELDLMAVTARWASAAERLWIATATSPVANDRLSLALDFGAWLGRVWPGLRTDMDFSWDWRQTREGESDTKLSWNLLLGW